MYRNTSTTPMKYHVMAVMFRMHRIKYTHEALSSLSVIGGSSYQTLHSQQQIVLAELCGCSMQRVLCCVCSTGCSMMHAGCYVFSAVCYVFSAGCYVFSAVCCVQCCVLSTSSLLCRHSAALCALCYVVSLLHALSCMLSAARICCAVYSLLCRVSAARSLLRCVLLAVCERSAGGTSLFSALQKASRFRMKHIRRGKRKN